MLQISKSALNQDLVSLDDVRDELGFSRKDDARIRRYIRQASNVIANAAGRVFREESVVESFAPKDDPWNWAPRQRLSLSRYPVNGLTSVVDGTATLDPVDYLLDADAGLLRRYLCGRPACWSPLDRVTVAYSGGYRTIQDVPAGLQLACLRLIGYLDATRGRDSLLRSLTIPNVQEETYFQAPSEPQLPADVMALLAEYTRPVGIL